MMFGNKSIVALFAIVIALSPIIFAGGFVDSAYAHTTKNKVKQHPYGLSLPLPFSGPSTTLHNKDNSISGTAHNANTGDSNGSIENTNSITTKEMNIWKKICNT
jgi:hypothetical protein